MDGDNANHVKNSLFYPEQRYQETFTAVGRLVSDRREGRPAAGEGYFIRVNEAGVELTGTEKAHGRPRTTPRRAQ